MPKLNRRPAAADKAASEQHARFVGKARELECNEDPQAFADTLRRIVRPQPAVGGFSYVTANEVDDFFQKAAEGRIWASGSLTAEQALEAASDHIRQEGSQHKNL